MEQSEYDHYKLEFWKGNGKCCGPHDSACRDVGILAGGSSVNRRKFVRNVSLGLAATATELAAAQDSSGATPTLYFVDGYHGGAKGHMPAGSWRDILNALKTYPKWKL